MLELDGRWREAVARFEELRAEQNAASKAIGRAKGSGDEAASAAAVAAMQEVSGRVKALGAEQAELERSRDAVLATLENLGDPDAPDEDTVLRVVGGDEASLPRGRDHLELAGDLIDMEAGARVAGSRFAYVKGDLVFLEFALVRWALEKLAGHGFTPVVPPVLVREEALFGTGQVPGSEDQIYRVGEDDLWLVGTSEVPLASLHAGEVLDEVPKRYAGFSTCFRREAGAAGRDTRGMFRVHQFDKVEMFSFVDPAESAAEHERLLAIEEEVLGELGIPYRVVDIAVNDLGASAARKFDLEAWLPGQGRHRELTSCSNTTDFQARRLDVRFRPDGGQGKPAFVHTLNGTCVAVGRTMIALLENGQREDGSVALPEVLRAYGGPAELRTA